THAGEPLHASVPFRFVPDKPKVESRLLASYWLYAKISLWQPPAYDQFKKTLEHHLSARGVIIDLRNNPGGDAAEVLKIAALFFQTKQPFGSFVNRSGKTSALVAEPHQKTPYSGPIAILIDVSSGSGSELFASVMQETHRASIVGRTSCGCLLGIQHFKKLKGGGSLAISELDYVSPGGQKIEGRGVVPDITVPLTIADLSSGRDAMLTAAESRLAEVADNTRIVAHPTPAATPKPAHFRKSPQSNSAAPPVPPRPHKHR
ncbi:MAG: S41 family peptidase, partial [Blastocatellia bacterium]